MKVCTLKCLWSATIVECFIKTSSAEGSKNLMNALAERTVKNARLAVSALICACRGVAGVVFIHKIAGAMAESGAPLDSIVGTLRHVASKIWTAAAALSGCTIPGSFLLYRNEYLENDLPAK